MTIDSNNCIAVNQTSTGNEVLSLTAHDVDISTGVNDIDNISMHTRLLCIAAAFVLTLTALPAPM